MIFREEILILQFEHAPPGRGLRKRHNTQPMNMQYHTSRRVPRLWMRALIPALGLALAAGACNSDSDNTVQTGYVEPTDVAVTGFKLKADSKVLTGLDTVFFSIDLQRGLIYNADSLPKGTRVTDLIPVITYSDYISSAIITMEGGQKRSGETNYKSHPNDSIDFTGDVKLTLTASAGNYRTYTLKVNVHQTEPDSLCWGPVAVSKLPSRLGSPAGQRTVQFKDKVTALILEQDGSYTLSTNPDPATAVWTRHAVTPGFTPRLRTMTATADKLWILAEDGTLHYSADGADWQPTAEKWHSIVGEYDNDPIGVKATDGGYVITRYGQKTDTPLPAGFPIQDFSNMYSYRSQWMSSPVSVLTGGVTATGEVSSDIWAYDGTSWAKLCSGAVPATRGAALVPYYTFRRTGSSWNYIDYSTIFMIGGMKADGSLNDETYISYDNGVNWTKAPSLLQMPPYIPPMWQADITVNSRPMLSPLPTASRGWSEMPVLRMPAWYRVQSSVDNDVISWDCPYIFLYGGYDPQGRLYDTVWRGVINRLSFTPII